MDYNQKLREIRSELDRLHLSDRGIDNLHNLVNEADRIAQVHTLSSLANNTRQTISKQLNLLMEVRHMPKKRIGLWNSAIQNFKQDLDEYLNYLDFTSKK